MAAVIGFDGFDDEWRQRLSESFAPIMADLNARLAAIMAPMVEPLMRQLSASADALANTPAMRRQMRELSAALTPVFDRQVQQTMSGIDWQAFTRANQCRTREILAALRADEQPTVSEQVEVLAELSAAKWDETTRRDVLILLTLLAVLYASLTADFIAEHPEAAAIVLGSAQALAWGLSKMRKYGRDHPPK